MLPEEEEEEVINTSHFTHYVMYFQARCALDFVSSYYLPASVHLPFISDNREDFSCQDGIEHQGDFQQTDETCAS